MHLAAILVAAGTGSRFGAETPKQFLTLLGQPVIRHAAMALIEAGAEIQPVGDAALIAVALEGLPHLRTVPGGATRQDSVRAGLLALKPHAPAFVLVQDAARPVIPPGTVTALLTALEATPGAIPAAPWSGHGETGWGITGSTLALDTLTRPRFVLVDASRGKRELWWYPYTPALREVALAMATLRCGTAGLFARVGALFRLIGAMLKRIRGG